MSSKIKNIIIFAVIIIVVIAAYFFFTNKKTPALPSLSGSAGAPIENTPAVSDQNAIDATSGQEFLATLLSIKNITLNDHIFSDPAFKTLNDSTKELVPEGNEGRPNPFAPIGTDTTTTPVTPPSATPPVETTIQLVTPPAVPPATGGATGTGTTTGVE